MDGFIGNGKLRVKASGSDMVLAGEGSVPYLFYPVLEDMGLVRHGFSTRLGGVSEGHLASMNLSFSRGDKEEAVRENFRRMTKALAIPMENLVFSAQTHTTNVRRVTAEDRGRGLFGPVGYQDVDGLITDEPGVCLTTFYADCVPLLFVDPVRQAIGLSHSGWRGTVARMGQRTLEAMEEAFGSNPADIIAAIGPSICRDCYEVSKEVAGEFEREFSGHEQKIVYPRGNDKYHLDLWEANRQILRDAGIKEEHILMSGLCTSCNCQTLFSHRASGGRRGNLAAFLELKA